MSAASAPNATAARSTQDRVRLTMLPLPYVVVDRHVETADSATLRLEPVERRSLPPFAPGQFTMLCVPGVGEVAISISGDPARRTGR